MWKKTMYILLFSILIGVVGCSNDNDKEGAGGDKYGDITYFSPETLEMLEDLATAYENKYEGANVEASYGGTNDIVNKLIAEEGNPSGDVWYGAGGYIAFAQADKKGLLESYTPEAAKDWDSYNEDDVKVRDDDWKWVGVNFRTLGFIYNTELISEEEAPKTWDDLLDPKWKGKIQFSNPAASGTSTLLVLSQLSRLGEEAGWEYFEKLVDQVDTIPDAGSAPAKAVAQGEAVIGIVLDYHAYTQQGNGESVDFILPEETPVLANPAALVKDAPNVAGGQEMIEFLLSDEAQQIFADNYMIPMSDTVEVKTPLTLEKVMENAQDLDADWIIEHYDDVREEWRERFG